MPLGNAPQNFLCLRREPYLSAGPDAHSGREQDAFLQEEVLPSRLNNLTLVCTSGQQERNALASSLGLRFSASTSEERCSLSSEGQLVFFTRLDLIRAAEDSTKRPLLPPS